MQSGIDDILARLLDIRARRRPVLVCIDGRSGVGKSTFASELAQQAGATLIDGDAFFAGGTSLRRESPAERAALCIDRPKQIAVLEQLQAGRGAVFRPFDWEAFDGSLAAVPVVVPAANDTIVLEGVYACHPDLAPLIDLTVLLRAPEPVRQARLLAREGAIGAWERQWHEAEDWYFSHVMSEERFDVIVDN